MADEKEQVSQENIPLEGKFYERLEPRWYPATIRVENLGRQKYGSYNEKPFVKLHFTTVGPSGRDVVVDELFHNSCHPTGKLYPVIVAAYGEPSPDFNIATLNGRMVLIDVTNQPGKKDPNLLYNKYKGVKAYDKTAAEAQKSVYSRDLEKRAAVEADIKRITEKYDAKARAKPKSKQEPSGPMLPDGTRITDADLPENLR